MFKGFAGVWTPVLAASELPPGKAVRVKVADTPLVFFRDAQGRPSALIDRCPHRGVALSLGRVEAGNLVCPFHGWQFDSRGDNCRVPWNPDAKRDLLCATAFSVRERGGQVWVFTGGRAEEEPQTDEAFERDSVRVTGFTVTIDTHWTRAMENMLDWPHLPFVHRSSIGRGMVKAARRARLDIALEQRPYGFTSSIAIDGVSQPGRLDFRFPNVMNLYILIPRRTLVMQVACVPETPSRTRMVLTTARDFLKLGALDWLFHWQNMKIVNEDRLVVESSFPAIVPPAEEERSVRTDAPTLAFRKQYYAKLHDSVWDPATRTPRSLSVIGGD